MCYKYPKSMYNAFQNILQFPLIITCPVAFQVRCYITSLIGFTISALVSLGKGFVDLFWLRGLDLTQSFSVWGWLQRFWLHPTTLFSMPWTFPVVFSFDLANCVWAKLSTLYTPSICTPLYNRVWQLIFRARID